jgi:hypothetical protein
MKLTTTLSTLVLALGLTTTGCSKKKDAATDKPATEAAKPTEEKPATPSAAPATGEPAKADPAAAAAPAAGAVTFASDDEYIAEGKAMLGKVLEVFKAAGTDCDKLAKGLNEMAADPKIAATTAYEKDHPEAKKKFMEATQGDMEKFMEVMGPALGACKDHKGVGDAMTKMGS